MPKYLIQGGYTAEGTKGVRKDGGSKRRQVAEALMKEAGCRLEVFYFTFGDSDFVGVVDAPANDIAAMETLSGASTDRKSTRLNSSHLGISYAVFCLKKKKRNTRSWQLVIF